MMEANLKTCLNRSRARGLRPNTRRRYSNELRRAEGANKKKYNAMKYRMNRPTGRPSFNDTKVIIRSSVRLPRSGLRAHSERIARDPRGSSAGFVAIAIASSGMSGCQGAGGHQGAGGYSHTPDRKSDRPVRQYLVLERQRLSRPHRVQIGRA